MEKINIAKLLKDCPKGMELDCTMYDNVSFVEVTDADTYSIIIKTKSGFRTRLTKYGQNVTIDDAKCVIFPKGKTTWEGFQKPFKDGDIVADEHGNITIYKGTMWYNKKLARYYCGYRKSDNHFLPEPKRDGHFGLIEELHYATEEEKERLFKAIKDNGYRWNTETKTLEKLIKPKFKVGDRIKDKNNKIWFVVHVSDKHFDISLIPNAEGYFVPIEDQDNWELVPNKFDINTLKPFESRVLVRDKNTDEWRGQFFSHYDNGLDRPYICISLEGLNEYKQCIPYEENKFLLGKTDDCDDFYKNW